MSSCVRVHRVPRTHIVCIANFLLALDACVSVGNDSFVQRQLHQPPSPIFYCQQPNPIGLCYINDCAPKNTYVNITYFSSMDPVVQGQPFAVSLSLEVFKPVGTGQILWRLWSATNETQSLTSDVVVDKYDLTDSLNYSLQVQKQPKMALGHWNAEVVVCEGDCDWIELNGPHTRLLGKGMTSFRVIAPSNPVSSS
jgi:hypothetical protein